MVRGRSLVGVAREGPPVGKHHHSPDAIGGRAGHAPQPFGHRPRQVTEVFVPGVGTKRAGRDLHAAQIFPPACGPLRDLEPELRAAPLPAQRQLRIDRPAHRVGHSFGEEHAQDGGSPFDQQALHAALFEFGDDKCGRNWTVA